MDDMVIETWEWPDVCEACGGDSIESFIWNKYTGRWECYDCFEIWLPAHPYEMEEEE